MIVFKLIPVFVLLTALANPVLSEVDCTDLQNPVSKEVFMQNCINTFCKCFSMTEKCPPEWSRNFADGIVNYVYRQGSKTVPKGEFSVDGFSRSINCGPPLKAFDVMVLNSGRYLYLQLYIPSGSPRLYFTKEYSSLTKIYKGHVRNPDQEYYLNNSIFRPQLNSKGLFEFRVSKNSTELVDSSLSDYYTTSFSLSSVNPLFDTIISGPIHPGFISIYFPYEKYYGNNESVKVSFTPVTLDKNFEFRYFPWITWIKTKRKTYICLGHKDEPQKGLNFTTEACRPTFHFRDYRTYDKDLGANFEIQCECNFDTIPIDFTKGTLKEDKGTANATAQKPVYERPEWVEGFNEILGPIRYRKSVDGASANRQSDNKPKRATKLAFIFCTLLLCVCGIIILVCVGVFVYTKSYK